MRLRYKGTQGRAQPFHNDIFSVKHSVRPTPSHRYRSSFQACATQAPFHPQSPTGSSSNLPLVIDSPGLPVETSSQTALGWVPPDKAISGEEPQGYGSQSLGQQKGIRPWPVPPTSKLLVPRREGKSPPILSAFMTPGGLDVNAAVHHYATFCTTSKGMAMRRERNRRRDRKTPPFTRGPLWPQPQAQTQPRLALESSRPGRDEMVQGDQLVPQAKVQVSCLENSTLIDTADPLATTSEIPTAIRKGDRFLTDREHLVTLALPPYDIPLDSIENGPINEGNTEEIRSASVGVIDIGTPTPTPAPTPTQTQNLSQFEGGEGELVQEIHIQDGNETKAEKEAVVDGMHVAQCELMHPKPMKAREKMKIMRLCRHAGREEMGGFQSSQDWIRARMAKLHGFL